MPVPCQPGMIFRTVRRTSTNGSTSTNGTASG
jgi:hypothetical protein